MTENINLKCALDYVRIGLFVFPCHSIRDGKCSCGDEMCSKPGKHPRTINGFKDASTNENIIKKYWENNPDANIGCATGEISGIVVLDLDIKHNRTSKEFQIPPTISAKSGGGGEHFYFKYPNKYIKSTNGQLFGDGVDIKGDGGYVILAPSSHISGNNYEWIVPFDSKEELADLPEWLLKAIEENTEKKSDSKLWQKEPREILEGSRNESLASFTGKILHDLSPDLWNTAGWDSIVAHNKKIPQPLSEKELCSIFESVKKYHTDSKNIEFKDDSLLSEICSREDVKLFHDEQGETYISISITGHQEIWSCKSKSMKRFISSKSWERNNKKPIGSESIKNIINVLEGKAFFDNPEIKLHNRVAWFNNELWYDLTNKNWQIVKINKDGWEIVESPPIIFKRYSHNKAQIIPIHNGDINLFLNYINIINPEHRLLLLVFLVSCFVPDFPHVMLVVFGAQGSSKSTLLKLARLLVDPSVIDVASFPNNQKELVQILAHHYFIPFDNVSYISEEQSDTLCKAITGGGHSKRELYENDEDIIYSFMRCIGLNGINLVTTRPDLLERSLLLELERIEPDKRKTEKELYKNFNCDLPYILGGVFEVLSKAIKIYPTIELNSYPRMADWTIWGCAISEALGYKKEEFLNAYQNNVTKQTEMLLNENIVATAIIIFMEDKDDWENTATELLKELSTYAILANIDTREKYWPKGANALSRKLNELSTPLKKIGISVTNISKGYERHIHLKKVGRLNEITQPDDIDDNIASSSENISTREIPFLE